MTVTSPDTRKEQIYRAASTLFSERGYRSTSIRDIARELDLQGGSLYAHISSKEDVLWEIIARVAESFYAAVRPIAESDGSATERLRGMIHAHVGVVVNELARAAVFFQDWRHLSEPRKGEVLALRDGYEALFRLTIADGVASGELADRDPRLASIFVLTALNGIPGWFRADGERTADDIADELATMILDGLGRPS
ncbi:MAG TPA: TetR/AcrR family transcriptional regulator [Thermomicrobiales bacterium]|nr:TetR/AcrR family transcriptional regulator [Thermomicrobiales bacterium]